MPHVIFDPDSVDWSGYFREMAAGNCHQTGGGAYFIGSPYQRGAGIGSMFGSVFRFLMPMLKTFGQEIGREGLAAGSRVLEDIASGGNLRNSVVNNASDGLRNILSRHDANEGLRSAVNTVQRKLQKGSGIRKRVIRSKQQRSVRSRIDQLGIY